MVAKVDFILLPGRGYWPQNDIGDDLETQKRRLLPVTGIYRRVGAHAFANELQRLFDRHVGLKQSALLADEVAGEGADF